MQIKSKLSSRARRAAVINSIPASVYLHGVVDVLIVLCIGEQRGLRAFNIHVQEF